MPWVILARNIGKMTNPSGGRNQYGRQDVIVAMAEEEKVSSAMSVKELVICGLTVL